MASKIRYRLYGVVDEELGGIQDLLKYMKQYGNAFVVKMEVVDYGKELPDAEEDFQQTFNKQ